MHCNYVFGSLGTYMHINMHIHISTYVELEIYIYACCYFLVLRFAFSTIICSIIIVVSIVMATCVIGK